MLACVEDVMNEKMCYQEADQPTLATRSQPVGSILRHAYMFDEYLNIMYNTYIHVLYCCIIIIVK